MERVFLAKYEQNYAKAYLFFFQQLTTLAWVCLESWRLFPLKKFSKCLMLCSLEPSGLLELFFLP